jgi:Na+-translocating ferredoxin:NAD+ oxidoreductase RNF subunit RnfB
MTENSYWKLAEYLNTMPLGFPRAASGVEMKILRKLFSPDEARIASKMTPAYESPGQIAERLGEKAEELGGLLERMLSKGLTDGRGPRGGREYRIMPFLSIHGDLPLSKIDKEYVELFEEYLSESFVESMGKAGPPYIRAFPAEHAIPADHSARDFERVSKMVAEATHYVITDCACCGKRKLVGKDCSRRAHRCISLYNEEDFRPDIRIEYREGRRATREEVLNLLQTAEEEGFIHTGTNIQEGHSHICNCCPDCCPFLRMVRLDKSSCIIAPANYAAFIDPETCVACGVCAEERCPVNAIESTRETCMVNPLRCLGCGACVLTCPSGALSLRPKEGDQLYVPPLNIFEWVIKRSAKKRNTIESAS